MHARKLMAAARCAPSARLGARLLAPTNSPAAQALKSKHSFRSGTALPFFSADVQVLHVKPLNFRLMRTPPHTKGTGWCVTRDKKHKYIVTIGPEDAESGVYRRPSSAKSSR